MRACIALGAALCLLVPAVVLAEGTQTGVISGRVAGQDGGGLQGVEVTLSGSRGERSALSDEEGRFRFPALPVGEYTVAARLLGLEASQTGIAVNIDNTTEVALVLEPSSAPPPADSQGWIQVIAEASILDPFDSRVRAGLRSGFLAELPVQRFYQSVALALPGISGGEDGNPHVSGALRGDNVFLVDGVDTTDPTTGLFGLNLSFEAIEAVDVTTAARSGEYALSSGAVINVVTRSGDDEYRGSLRWLATNTDWNGDYDYVDSVADHLAAEEEAANTGLGRIDQTVALTLGGPLAAKKLWFFGAFEDGERSLLRPTVEGSAYDEAAQLESAAIKLSAQPTAALSLVVQSNTDEARFNAFSPFDRGPGENRASQTTPRALRDQVVNRLPGEVFALENRLQQGEFSKLQGTWTAGQSLAFDLTLARQERELLRDGARSRGLAGDAPHLAIFADPGGDGDPVGEVQDLILFNGVTDRGGERRPRRQANFGITGYFRLGKGEHELRAGLDYQRTQSRREFAFPGIAGTDRATGNAVSGQLFLDLDFREQCVSAGLCVPFDPESGLFQPFLRFNYWQRPVRETTLDASAIYLRDTILWDRWSLSLGARLERLRGKDESGRALVNDTVVAPRLALSYDPFGDGLVLLSASAGRSYEPFKQEYLDSFSRLEIFSGYTEYGWAGLAGIDCSEQDPSDFDSPCWIGNEVVDPRPIQLAPPNLGLRRASVDELTLGFERRLGSAAALSLHYVSRDWNDLWDNRLRLTSIDPVIADSEVVNLRQARRTYRALQLLLQKRFSNHWQLLGSYTWSETEGNLFRADGLATFEDFADYSDLNQVNRFGPAPYDRPHRFRIYGNWQRSLRRLNLSLGGVVRYDSGLPFQVEVADPLGLRFVTPRGSERLSQVTQLDLSARAALRWGSNVELSAKLEVFNVTDEREVLAVQTQLDSGLFGLAASLTDLQAPRALRLTVGLGF